MSFASPFWLIALLPWLAFCLWMLWGRRSKTNVPFLQLWNTSQLRTRPRRSFERPPIALAAMLLALLLAICAAAGPVINGQSKKRQSITLILDRGLSMSIDSAPAQPSAHTVESPHFVRTVQELSSVLTQFAPDVIVNLKIVPGPNAEDHVADWQHRIETLSPTGVGDFDELTLAARQSLNASDDPVLLLSDQHLSIQNDRLIQIAPSSPLVNVGIELLSARIDPHPQVMVRIFNQSPLIAATLKIRSADREIAQQIALPSRGQRKDYFIDLPIVGESVEMEIQADDPPAPNHRAWLVRRSAWPRIEPRSTLSPALQRMIDIYARHRPPGDGSKTVAVMAAIDGVAIPPESTIAIIVDENSNTKPLAAIEPLIVSDQSLKLDGINWPSVLLGAAAASIPMGWTPIVTAAGMPIVAIRTEPARQVWVGFDSPAFASSPDFVIFWTTVFDWLGDGRPEYSSAIAGRLIGHWSLRPAAQSAGITTSADDVGLIPGIYQSSQGDFQAVNASPLPNDLMNTPTWRSRLIESLRLAHQSQRPIDGHLLIVAMALLCFAAMTWTRNRIR